MIQLVDILAAGVTDSAGEVVANGSVAFYGVGTSTLVTVYQDNESSTPHSNPADLDAAGRLIAWADQGLKLVISDEDGAVVRTIDGVGLSDSDISAANTNTISGDGLVEVDGDLNVNVDDETIEIEDNQLRVKDNGISADKFSDAGMSGRPGHTWNIGLINATTNAADDSIKLTSMTGATLSATNQAHLLIQSTTVGSLLSFDLTSDVSIDLTGAHFAYGGTGNQTDVKLRWIVINDSGTLKHAITVQENLRFIANTNSSTTATSVTTRAKVLTKTSLSAGTWPCAEIGWFYANFNDTGDVWTVQSGVGDLNIGHPIQSSITNWEAYTPTGSWTANTPVYTGFWRLVGDTLECKIRITAAGSVDASNLTLDIPPRFVIDTAKLTGSTSLLEVVGDGQVVDVSGDSHPCQVNYHDTNSVIVSVWNAASTYARYTTVTNLIPMTWASGDFALVRIAVPVVGYSVVS